MSCFFLSTVRSFFEPPVLCSCKDTLGRLPSEPAPGPAFSARHSMCAPVAHPLQLPRMLSAAAFRTLSRSCFLCSELNLRSSLSSASARGSQECSRQCAFRTRSRSCFFCSELLNVRSSRPSSAAARMLSAVAFRKRSRSCFLCSELLNRALQPAVFCSLQEMLAGRGLPHPLQILLPLLLSKSMLQPAVFSRSKHAFCHLLAKHLRLVGLWASEDLLKPAIFRCQASGRSLASDEDSSKAASFVLNSNRSNQSQSPHGLHSQYTTEFNQTPNHTRSESWPESFDLHRCRKSPANPSAEPTLESKSHHIHTPLPWVRSARNTTDMADMLLLPPTARAPNVPSLQPTSLWVLFS